MNIENYIKSLAPKLQEKARACTNVQELLALAKEAKLPVPDEALAAIAGGDDPDPENCGDPAKCPKCGSTNTNFDFGSTGMYYCLDCGYMWR